MPEGGPARGRGQFGDRLVLFESGIRGEDYEYEDVIVGGATSRWFIKKEE